jgi:predicted MFS family arabinose efflux permease
MATLVTTRLPVEGRARALGALVAIYDACVGLGAVVLGQVSDVAGTRAVFRTAAAVSVLGAVICVAVTTRAHSVTTVTREGEPVPEA